MLLTLPAFNALSNWQWRRLHVRQAFNSTILDAQALPTVALTTLENTSSKPTVPTTAEWRTVGATGTWNTGEQVLVRKKSFESDMGFWVMTPLVMNNGHTVLVNRGWIPARNSALDTPEVRTPPSGKVHVTGRLRVVPPTGPAEPHDIPQGQVNTIVPSRIVRTDPVLTNAYIEMTASRPQSLTSDLKQIDAPEVSEGPHRSYALQWIFFAIMTVLGWAIIVRNEFLLRRNQSAESAN